MTGGGSRPICLDITRLASRVGAGPRTGIDRVEHAYLSEFLSRDVTLFGLARTASGFSLLDRAGLSAFAERLDGRVPWGAEDLAGRMSRRISPARRRAESDLRRLAIASALRGGGRALLHRHLPDRVLYLNVGHTNLTGAVLGSVRTIPGAAICVLVHDTIPIRFPYTQRPGTADRFAARLAEVAAHADVVVAPSEAEKTHVAEAFAEFPRQPAIVACHLGQAAMRPDVAALGGAAPAGPYFVTVGTIEPRKNHRLLLDVWERLPEPVPALCVVGRRGWNDAELFRRLDEMAAPSGRVREFGDMGDGALAALLLGSRALLFPSIAEGFGFPPVEARTLGVPVVCAPLPVYRETLGDWPVYAGAHDLYQWEQIVRRLAADGGAQRSRQDERSERAVHRTWQDHLNDVLSHFP